MAGTYLGYLEDSSRAEPSASALARLASALGTSVPLLLGGDARAPLDPHAAPAGPPRLEVLDEAACRALVGTGGVGRVVFADQRGPVALLVNLAVVDGDVVFRTGDGSVRAAVAAGREVSVELDHLDAERQEGWSVLLRGPVTIEDPQAPDGAVRSWAGAPRSTTVRLHPDQVTGRRVHHDR